MHAKAIDMASEHDHDCASVYRYGRACRCEQQAHTFDARRRCDSEPSSAQLTGSRVAGRVELWPVELAMRETLADLRVRGWTMPCGASLCFASYVDNLCSLAGAGLGDLGEDLEGVVAPERWRQREQWHPSGEDDNGSYSVVVGWLALPCPFWATRWPTTAPWRRAPRRPSSRVAKLLGSSSVECYETLALGAPREAVAGRHLSHVAMGMVGVLWRRSRPIAATVPLRRCCSTGRCAWRRTRARTQTHRHVHTHLYAHAHAHTHAPLLAQANIVRAQRRIWILSNPRQGDGGRPSCVGCAVTCRSLRTI